MKRYIVEIFIPKFSQDKLNGIAFRAIGGNILSFVFCGNVLKNGWWLIGIKVLKCAGQSEEEVGAAEEQPTSNKIDAYTKNEDGLKSRPFYDILW
jgi:hypothetical protein